MHRSMHLVTLLIVVLVIASGCSVAETDDTTATITPGERPESLQLRSDGLGAFDFGDPIDEVTDGVSAVAGGWDADSSDPESPLAVPDCGSADTRVISWGILVATFTFGEFHSWSYGFDPITGDPFDARHLNLATPDGVTLGTSRTELTSALGARVHVVDDTEIDLSTFTIDGDEPLHIGGHLTSSAPDGAVQLLESRPACSAP